MENQYDILSEKIVKALVEKKIDEVEFIVSVIIPPVLFRPPDVILTTLLKVVEVAVLIATPILLRKLAVAYAKDTVLFVVKNDGL